MRNCPVEYHYTPDSAFAAEIDYLTFEEWKSRMEIFREIVLQEEIQENRVEEVRLLAMQLKAVLSFPSDDLIPEEIHRRSLVDRTRFGEWSTISDETFHMGLRGLPRRFNDFVTFERSLREGQLPQQRRSEEIAIIHWPIVRVLRYRLK
jgi:hypothetical protein